VSLAEANLSLALAQLEQAQREYDRIKDGVSPADVALLEAQLSDARRAAQRVKEGPDPEALASARARVAAAQAAVEVRFLKAPFDGVITQVNILPGDVVSPGSPAFRLDDLSSLHIDLQISEVDINRLRPGQAVSVHLEGIPGIEYTGRLVAVPAVGDVVNDLVTFSVEAEIQNADSRVRPGMTASAEITLTDLMDVLLIPARAVRFIDGQRTVYLLRDAKAVPVPVSLGLSSATETQVLEGDIQAGDLVILNP
jgi:HlyD family secretion protein